MLLRLHGISTETCSLFQPTLCSAAEIIVRLRNRGEDAYKHNVYGDSITIIRRIHVDGSGSWKLQGHDGKTKSTQRAELSRICDHLDIQVDNPMSVLNQDAARQFLSASNPEEKYVLFLKGTQLTHLAQEMDTLKEHNLEIKTALVKQKEALPDLKAEYEEKLHKFAQFEKQRQGKQKLDELTDRYIWSQVSQAKRKMDESAERVETQEAKMTKAQQTAQELSEKIEMVNHTLSLIEQERVKDRDADDEVVRKRDQARAKLRLIEGEQNAHHMKVSEINGLYQTYKLQLETAQEKLNRELAKANQAGERDTWVQKRTEGQIKAQELENEMTDLQVHKDELDRKQAPIQEAILNFDSDLTRAGRSINSAERTVHEIKAASQDNLSAFGNAVPALVRAIKQDNGWRDMPVGPVGTFIKLKDEAWLNIIESILDKDLNAFCVTNEQDRQRLLRLSRSLKCASSVPILRGEDDIFDYSSGEPEADLTTLLRVCDFESDYIKRQLIVSRSIEKMILVRERSSGDTLLRARPQLQSVFSADLYRISGGDRTSSSTTMNRPTGPHRLSKDNSGALAEAEAAVTELRAEFQRIQQAREEKRTELRAIETEIRSLTERITILHHTLRQVQTEVARLTVQLQAQMTVDVDVYQEMVDESRRNMDEAKERFVLANDEGEEVAHRLADAQTEYEEASRHLSERENGQMNIAQAAEKEAQNRIALSHKISHLSNQMQAYSAELSQLAEQQAVDEADYHELLRQAKEHTLKDFVEVSPDETPDKIEKDIRAWEQYMDKMRHHTGGNIDAAKTEIEEAQHKLETLKTRIAKLDQFARQLDRSFNDRWTRWHLWRSVIALRARSLFTANLEHRGFSGSLSFDHESQGPDGRRRPGKLLIKVQTEHGPGASSKFNLQKETRALSGGEKSFSTICLLLSLWEAINCPIRCLDEFDVFMDSANRAISTRMIVDACKINRRVQYVLISPQSMTSTELGDDTRVIMMRDPERN